MAWRSAPPQNRPTPGGAIDTSLTLCSSSVVSLQTFLKGVPPRQKLLPTGGTVFTAEEKYMAAVDKCFPDDSST